MSEAARDIVATLKNISNYDWTRRMNLKPDEPSVRDLMWYHEWSVKHRRLNDIAEQAEVNRRVVNEAIDRVDAWIRSQSPDHVTAYRIRQTETLEQAVADCLVKWNEESTLSYLEEARKLLTDIRRIWGIDKPEKPEATNNKYAGLVRVAGMTRAQAVRAQVAVMLDAIAGEE